MIDLSGALIGFAVMLGLIMLGIPVGASMFLISALGGIVYFGPSILGTFGAQLWAVMNDFLLTAIPLFILLGEFLLRSGVTQRMYHGLSDWISGLPGGLLHTNIGASALFASVSGSSVATAATIGTIALPEFRQRQYNERLVLGSIAAGATLGILIPPSVNMIIYGAMTNTSIARLFMAGVVPGLVLAAMFMLTIIIICMIWSNMAAKSEVAPPMIQRIRNLRHLVPPLMVFIVVMGSIYLGWATPTEAAAVGVLMAFAIATFSGKMSIELLHESFLSTVRITAMILLIIVAAFYLNFIVGTLGIPQMLGRAVAEIGVTPLMLILVLFAFYLVLGCFIEILSMMVGTLPIVFPLVVAAGIDPVWFGIFLVLMMEIGLVTPPTGLNLFVVQGVRGQGSVVDVFWGVLPFIGTLILLVALIVIFPAIVLWLPQLMFGS